MSFVYILQSKRDGRYYIGSTIDLKSRLRHHQGGFTHSTKRFGALKLVLKQEYPTLRGARFVEARLKKLKRRDYINTIVRDGKIKIKPE